MSDQHNKVREASGVAAAALHALLERHDDLLTFDDPRIPGWLQELEEGAAWDAVFGPCIDILEEYMVDNGLLSMRELYPRWGR